MKTLLLGLACLFTFPTYAFEYEQQFENDQICVARAKIDANEEIGLHRDVYPQIVIALKGGTITRLEADGSVTDVQFPTGVAVFRNTDPENELHKSVNRSDEPIELVIIQLKDNPPPLEKEKGYRDIAMNIRISCPPSEEFQQFVNSIPTVGGYDSSFAEWKASFISNIGQLLRLVESEKISNSWWSVKVDDENLEEPDSP